MAAAMSKRLEIEKYGLHSYDDYLCLRPSWPLIASLLFLCRGVAAYALVGISGGVPAGLNGIIDSGALWSGCLAAAPAAALLYALTARVPAAPAFVRRLWRHGRSLIALSVVSYVAIAATQYGADPRRWLGSPLAVKAVTLADIGILAYVFLSSRVRQSFLDFPVA
jgi:hypothetical protein